MEKDVKWLTYVVTGPYLLRVEHPRFWDDGSKKKAQSFTFMNNSGVFWGIEMFLDVFTFKVNEL